jgi:hypothetical protein
MGRISGQVKHLKVRMALAKAVHPPSQYVSDGSDADHEELYFFCSDVDDANEDISAITENFLEWKNGVEHRKFRNAYYGDSDISRWRRLQDQKHRENVASHCGKITDYFVKFPALVVDESNAESNTRNSEDELCTRMSLEEAIEKIPNVTNVKVGKSREKSNVSNYNFQRYIALERYFTGLLQNRRSKVQSSLEAAKDTFPKRAMNIRALREYFLRNSDLLEHLQGKARQGEIIN